MHNRINNLRKYMQAQNLDAIVVSSQSNRRYFSRFTGSTANLLILHSKAYFVTDFRYVEQATNQCFGFDVVDVSNYESYNKFFKKILTENQLKTIGVEGDYTTYNAYSAIKTILEGFEVKSINIDHLRMLKTEVETKIVKKAAEIAEKALDYVLKNVLKPGISELQVAQTLEGKMLEYGADKVAFDTIIASGKRGSLPHGVASEKLIEKGDFVTFDFGCYYQGYASDITRTVVVQEVKNLELKKIYEIVLEAQKRAIVAVKPGVTLGSIDKAARDYIEAAGYGAQFGHSTGHGLGMDVHEMPRVYYPVTEIIQAGMLFTIEPGIYVPGLGGVRIEDDIFVTEDGYEVLTSFEKELIVVK